MEIVLLVPAAILIGIYIRKCTPAIAIAHIIFLIILSYLSLFTTDIAPIAEGVKRLFGTEQYEYFRKIMCEPCIWIYSTNIAVFAVELLFLIILQLCVVVAVAKWLGSTGEKEFQRKTKPDFQWEEVPKRSTRAEYKKYLNYCELLN